MFCLGLTLSASSPHPVPLSFRISVTRIELIVSADASGIGGPDAKLDPVPLLERNSSTDLLAGKRSPKKQPPPNYDRQVQSSKKNTVPVAPSLTGSFQSDASTGAVGFSLVQFGERGKIMIVSLAVFFLRFFPLPFPLSRTYEIQKQQPTQKKRLHVKQLINTAAHSHTRSAYFSRRHFFFNSFQGGVSSKGPAKKLGLELGHIILELNGEDITRLDIRQIVFLLSEKKGQIFEIGVAKDSRFNFEQAMMETQRTVWFQRHDDSSSGLQLMSTDDGPRVERLLDNSAASIAAINVGDRIIEINNLEMQNSSGVEIFAALGLGTDHTLVLNPDSSPVIRSSGSSAGAFSVAESEYGPVGGGGSSGKAGNSLKGAKKGKRKQITLTAQVDKLFGFGVGGSLDDVGTRVQNLAPGGAADKSGKVRIGDRILMANGLDLSRSSTAEVVACLSMNKSVTLILEEDPTPLGSESISPNKSSKRHRLARRSAKDTAREGKSVENIDGAGIGPVRRVEIKRAPGSGLGLKILTDEECRIARISEIIPGRPAELCGGINIGDRLISANGTSLQNLTHENIVRVMLADTDVTVLELASDSAPMIDDSVRKTVTIHREPGEGIGLKIHSTQQSDGMAIGARIEEIIPGRPASKTGNISPGDWLIEANGVVLGGLSLDEIMGVLVSIKGKIVTLVLEPDDSAIEDAEVENEAAARAYRCYGRFCRPLNDCGRACCSFLCLCPTCGP